MYRTTRLVPFIVLKSIVAMPKVFSNFIGIRLKFFCDKTRCVQAKNYETALI